MRLGEAQAETHDFEDIDTDRDYSVFRETWLAMNHHDFNCDNHKFDYEKLCNKFLVNLSSVTSKSSEMNAACRNVILFDSVDC